MMLPMQTDPKPRIRRKRLLLGCAAALLIPALGIGVFLFLVFHRVHGDFMDSKGVPIHYTVEGSGEPVVLIHGLAANADLNWRRAGINRLLREDFQVIAFDCRGHGLSGQPEDASQYGLEFLHDVTRLMDHLDIERAHIVGYSMGGFVALGLAVDSPERLRSVAICAAGWRRPDDHGDILNPYRPPPEAALRHGVRWAGTVPVTHALKGPLNRIRNWIGGKINNRTALKAIRKSFDELRVTEAQLRANQVPAICFIGTRDGLKPYADDLSTVMANLEFVVLDGANHLLTPIGRDFQKQLRAFLLEHRATE